MIHSSMSFLGQFCFVEKNYLTAVKICLTTIQIHPKKKLDENHQARNGVSQKYLGDCKISWHSTQNKFLFTSHYTPSAYKHIPFCT